MASVARQLDGPDRLDMTSYRWKKISVPVLLLVIFLGVSFLWSLSTVSFRSWMAEWNMGRRAYPDAIQWYTRALRLADRGGDQQLRLKLIQKLYLAYEAFCNWDFESDRLWGWFGGDQIESLELGNGSLAIRSTGAAPSLELVRVSLSPSQKYRFAFRLRCRAGNQAQLFWSGGAEILKPDDQQVVPIKCDGAWEEHAIEIPPHPEGLGKFRFIAANAPGIIELDWIRITPIE